MALVDEEIIEEVIEAENDAVKTDDDVVKKEKRTKKPKEKAYRVHTSTLNCRSEPGTKNTIVRRFGMGEKIIVTETTLVKKELWGKCECGWVMLSYCREV